MTDLRVIVKSRTSNICAQYKLGVKVGFHYPSSRPEFTGRQLGP